MDTAFSTEKWILMTELNGEALLHHFKLSNFGNVVRIKKGREEEDIFLTREIGGYKYISFTTRKGSRETIYLHRLVAEFFVEGFDPDKPYVVHNDYDRRNNRSENLAWVSQDELYKHRYAKTTHPVDRQRKAQRTETTSNEARATENMRTRKLVSECLSILQ